MENFKIDLDMDWEKSVLLSYSTETETFRVKKYGS